MASPFPPSQTLAPSVLDPRCILDMNYAFASTAMLVALERLHFFTHMAYQALTPAALAALAHTAPRPTERLLKGLEGLIDWLHRWQRCYQLCLQLYCYGDHDVMIAGASEAPITPISNKARLAEARIRRRNDA